MISCSINLELMIVLKHIYFIVIGDLDAKVTIKNNEGSSIFCETLLKFCNEEGILMADYDYLPKHS